MSGQSTFSSLIRISTIIVRLTSFARTLERNPSQDESIRGSRKYFTSAVGVGSLGVPDFGLGFWNLPAGMEASGCRALGVQAFGFNKARQRLVP